MNFYKNILIIIFVILSFSNIYATEVKVSREFNGNKVDSLCYHNDTFVNIINHGLSGLRACVTYEYEKQPRQDSLTDEDDHSDAEEAEDNCTNGSYNIYINSKEKIDLRKLGFKTLVKLQICGKIKRDDDRFLEGTFDKAFWQKLIKNNLLKCITLHVTHKDNQLLLLTDEEYSKHIKSSTERDESYIK